MLWVLEVERGEILEYLEIDICIINYQLKLNFSKI